MVELVHQMAQPVIVKQEAGGGEIRNPKLEIRNKSE
jgi:hypothetical protein